MFYDFLEKIPEARVSVVNWDVSLFNLWKKNDRMYGWGKSKKYEEDAIIVPMHKDKAIFRFDSIPLKDQRITLKLRSLILQKQKTPPGIIVIPRCYKKIEPGSLAYYGNIGISAIHLAAAAGAKGVLLFGFDMKATKGKHHWHDRELSKPNDGVYGLFQRQFTNFARALRKHYPKFRAINTNTGSALKVFPRMPLAEARKEFQC